MNILAVGQNPLICLTWILKICRLLNYSHISVVFRLESLSEHLFGVTFDEVRKLIVCFKVIFFSTPKLSFSLLTCPKMFYLH